MSQKLHQCISLHGFWRQLNYLKVYRRNLNIYFWERLQCIRFKKNHMKFALTSVNEYFGNPSLINPTCVVVPPMSITIASCTPDKNAAPRILFVKPDANVSTGKRSASLELWDRQEHEELNRHVSQYYPSSLTTTTFISLSHYIESCL